MQDEIRVHKGSCSCCVSASKASQQMAHSAFRVKVVSVGVRLQSSLRSLRRTQDSTSRRVRSLGSVSSVAITWSGLGVQAILEAQNGLRNEFSKAHDQWSGPFLFSAQRAPRPAPSHNRTAPSAFMISAEPGLRPLRPGFRVRCGIPLPGWNPGNGAKALLPGETLPKKSHPRCNLVLTLLYKLPSRLWVGLRKGSSVRMAFHPVKSFISLDLTAYNNVQI